jgi:hypothetical protein
MLQPTGICVKLDTVSDYVYIQPWRWLAAILSFAPAVSRSGALKDQTNIEPVAVPGILLRINVLFLPLNQLARSDAQ